MSQYGFFVDLSRCTGCQACAVACKSAHQLPPGALKYLRIYQYEKGAFPHVRIHNRWIPCYHCEEPACVDACPTGAMYKEKKFGAVLLNQDDCTGCRICYDACPYGAPVFESDEAGIEAQKCDMCINRLEREEAPICASACPMRALDFGPLAELEAKYGSLRDLPDLPDSGLTRPAVIFKAADEKRQLVPYDVNRALELLMKRDSLPPIFALPTDVTDIPPGLVGRDRLVIKHETCEELIRLTKNDDG